MKFSQLVREIELYLHIQGTENRNLVKGFINDSSLEFLRLGEWDKCKKMDVITLDGTDVYPLNGTGRILTNVFHAELGLINSSGETYYKVDYNTYLISTEKEYLWSIFGNELYVTGDAVDLNFLYKTPGVIFPLSNDDDENLVTLYYSDVIKKMSAIKVYDFIGDNEQVQKEEQNFARMIISLKKEENRIRNNAKLHFIGRSA